MHGSRSNSGTVCRSVPFTLRVGDNYRDTSLQNMPEVLQLSCASVTMIELSIVRQYVPQLSWQANLVTHVTVGFQAMLCTHFFNNVCPEQN